MKKMKKILLVFLVALSLNGFAQQKELVWHTDVNKAINISNQSGNLYSYSLLEVIGVDLVRD
jgi:hypothetical protein